MWYVIFPFLTLCFFGGCMLSKVEHEKSVQKFEEVEEPELPSPEEIEIILSANG